MCATKNRYFIECSTSNDIYITIYYFNLLYSSFVIVISSPGVQFKSLQNSSIYLKDIDVVYPFIILFKFLEVMFIFLHNQYFVLLFFLSNSTILIFTNFYQDSFHLNFTRYKDLNKLLILPIYFCVNRILTLPLFLIYNYFKNRSDLIRQIISFPSVIIKWVNI